MIGEGAKNSIINIKLIGYSLGAAVALSTAERILYTQHDYHTKQSELNQDTQIHQSNLLGEIPHILIQDNVLDTCTSEGINTTDQINKDTNQLKFHSTETEFSIKQEPWTENNRNILYFDVHGNIFMQVVDQVLDQVTIDSVNYNEFFNESNEKLTTL